MAFKDSDKIEQLTEQYQLLHLKIQNLKVFDLQTVYEMLELLRQRNAIEEQIKTLIDYGY